MAKLKKTLPKNFRELIVAQDWDTLKAELLKCEPNAYERGGLEHISFASVDNKGKRIVFDSEMLKWLIENDRCDIHKEYWCGEKIIHQYSCYGEPKTIELLINAGADANDASYRFVHRGETEGYETPLHKAIWASFHNISNNVEVLLSNGANPKLNFKNINTPLEYLIYNINFIFTHLNLDISKKINRLENLVLNNQENILNNVELLIKYGADIHRYRTKELLQQVNEIFYQNYLNHYFSSPEVEEKMEQFELKLYELMQFEPN